MVKRRVRAHDHASEPHGDGTSPARQGERISSVGSWSRSWSRARSLAMAVWCCCLAACGSLVGIHPYDDGSTADGAQVGDGAADRGGGRIDAGAPGEVAHDGPAGAVADASGTPPDAGAPPPVLGADPPPGASDGGAQSLPTDGGSPDAGRGAAPPPPDDGSSAGGTSDALATDGFLGAPDAGAGDVAACPAVPTLSGTAYQFSAGPNNPKSGSGQCSFSNAKLPAAGHYYAAVDPDLYANAARCGVCLKATSGGQSVEAEIIDRMNKIPSSHGSTLALDVAAIKLLAGSAQNLDVEFSFVPCSDPGNVLVRFTSTNDASVYVMGARNQLKSIRMSSAGVAEVELTRMDYNAWIPPMTNGWGAAVTLTLTDVYDNVLVLPGTPVTASITDSGQQFPVPACPM